ncbi:MAG: serine hydrolase [Actinomycetota bacterium]
MVVTLGTQRLRRRSAGIIVAMAMLAVACGGGAGEETDGAGASASDGTPSSASTADASSTATETEQAEAPVAEPDADPFDRITATVEAFVEDEQLEGAGLLIVDVDDGVVYEEYFGAFGPDRISLIASASKMISAGVLLKLQQDGLLDLDAPVEDQVGWAVGNPDITPAQLVSNSAGLVGLRPDPLYAPYLCQWAAATTLQQCGETVFTTTADDDDQIPPDTGFRYGGAQWQIAGAVAESVSGKSWAELIDEIYVEPCGVESLGYINLGAVLTASTSGYPTVFGGEPDSVEPSDNPNIEGGAYITAPDYATLLLMHLRDGTCGDEEIFSRQSLDTMYADRIDEVYDGDAWGGDFGYGMGWWIDRTTGRIADPGAWGASPWLDLDDGYGAYLIIEDSSDNGEQLSEQLTDLVHAAVVGA